MATQPAAKKAKMSDDDDDGELGHNLFTAAEYETALKVVRAAGANLELYNTGPAFKAMRKALIPLIGAMAAKFPTDPRRNRAGRGEAEKRMRHARKQADAAADKKLLNASKLRSERIAKLKALQSSNPQLALVAVPDGVAEGDALAGVIPTQLAAASAVAIEGSGGGGSGGGGAAQSTAAASSGRAEVEGVVADVNPAESEAGAAAAAAGGPGELRVARSCYTCKQRFRVIHHFYDSMCPTCAKLNYLKRNQVADLTGRTIMVTGARVKIGYQTALKLLRCGATVVATTRFPADAARRFATEKDFANFKDRIDIYGLDMRHVPGVEAFAAFICSKYKSLEGIVNNACQTIRRPVQYYRHLMKAEKEAVAGLDGTGVELLKLEAARQEAAEAAAAVVSATAGAAAAACGAATGGAATGGGGGGGAPNDGPPTASAAASLPKSDTVATVGGAATAVQPFELSQVPMMTDDIVEDTVNFPVNAVDVNGQQIDLRTKTSWLLELSEVQTPEVCEVLAVNTIAPLILNSRLKTLLLKSPFKDRYVVNVSAMEGKFYRHKTTTHPHTNMAKAALNMMTRTSAPDYLRDNIYMTSVDTGWINDENPLEKAARIQKEHDFTTPLDEIDAAARVLDPIIAGVAEGAKHSGIFLKDFIETEW